MAVKVPRLSELQVTATKARFCAAVGAGTSELANLGRQVLDRISPPNWTLEWSLPGWLGDALELPATPTADLTLSNVYGLAYVRLQDDLADDEIAEEDRRVVLLLSTVLYQKWLQMYVGLFAGESSFWSFFERYMGLWVAATLDSHRSPTVAFQDYDDGDLRRLGDRGAPLKICAAGACLLAEREGLIPQLESALDHLLIGAVLLDHAQDWAGDLAAHRPSTFVAYASSLPQTPEYTEANRQLVWKELMVGREAQPYFALLRRHLQAAVDEARAAGVNALADYAVWLRRQANAYRRRLADDARSQLHDLAERSYEISISSYHRGNTPDQFTTGEDNDGDPGTDGQTRGQSAFRR